MSPALKVLHITSHLGGGIGRALAGMAEYNRAHAGVEDSFICLEAAQDTRYLDRIRKTGAHVRVEPSDADIAWEIAHADIVQLEWWHHPLMAGKLGLLGAHAARWVVWAHVSGLDYPAIPDAFTRLPHAFVATTPATLPILERVPGHNNIIDYVSSTGGFDGFPYPEEKPHSKLKGGYLGSLNPAKISPHFGDYIGAVDRDDFTIDVYGDSSVNVGLEEKIKAQEAGQKIHLHGFCHQPEEILPKLDLFIYLLNTTHYGTTENALLEAMACGVIPIVMNNPVEEHIVQHGVTGLIVDSPTAFAQAVNFLFDHPEERQRMRMACAQTVRRDFSVAHSAQKFAGIYRSVIEQDKVQVDFSAVIGKMPDEIFLSFLGKYAPYFAAGNEQSMRDIRLSLPFLYEKSKSSVHQFCSYFPDNARLRAWDDMLNDDKRYSRHAP